MKDLDTQLFMEEMMAAGNGGFTAAAPAEGPVAGFDPLMDKTDKVLRRRKKEERGQETTSMDNAPSIKDAKPKKKTDVKYYPGLGIAPVIKGVGRLLG